MGKDKDHLEVIKALQELDIEFPAAVEKAFVKKQNSLRRLLSNRDFQDVLPLAVTFLITLLTFIPVALKQLAEPTTRVYKNVEFCSIPLLTEETNTTNPVHGQKWRDMRDYSEGWVVSEAVTGGEIKKFYPRTFRNTKYAVNACEPNLRWGSP